jgi:hypothetical protein
MSSGEKIHMQSVRGVLGAATLLLALPITIVFQMLITGSDAVVIHVCLATGAFLLAASALDFQTWRPVTALGVGSAAALGVAFGLQALSELIANGLLYQIAYSVLGPAESIFLAGLLGWFVGISFVEGNGVHRIVGLTVVGIAVAAFSVQMGLTLTRGPAAAPEALRLVQLLPIAWLLWTSARRREQTHVQPTVA